MFEKQNLGSKPKFNPIAIETLHITEAIIIYAAMLSRVDIQIGFSGVPTVRKASSKYDVSKQKLSKNINCIIYE